MQESNLSSLNLAFVEGLYADFLREPQSVSPVWRDYFTALSRDGARPVLGPSFRPRGVFGHVSVLPPAAPAAEEGLGTGELQQLVYQLVRNHRVRGHRVARIDPLGLPRPQPPELAPSYYNLTDADLDCPFALTKGARPTTLRKIIAHLQRAYCGSIGVQFMHMDDLFVREWLQERLEYPERFGGYTSLTREEQLRILTRLTDAVIFEEFIQTKFIGAKSFSLEGAESLIPLLELAIERAAEHGVVEIVLGMAHRGRLNVLANLLGKSPHLIFREFEDNQPAAQPSPGDVKYHLGFSSEWMTAAGRRVHLSLCFNPSHLEYVNPVALGRLRAKQDQTGDAERVRGMGLLIHGDAAFAGEGIIQETLNLSELEGYTTGGTVHVIVNNQIGFTTPPSEGRSFVYASDPAKMLQAPIFHVNGEDPDAVAQVVRLALDFRRTFQRDVVIDMYCYRRRGHNEGDEPGFTQPLLYRAIEQRQPVREGYLEHLLKLGGVTREEADRIAVERQEHLEKELSLARSDSYGVEAHGRTGPWQSYVGGPESGVTDIETGVPAARLANLLEAQANLPDGFTPHPKIVRGLKLRQRMARGEKPLDWAAGESLAYASIATDGCRVRLAGQDTARGTFSHRHAVLFDYNNGEPYTPLANLAPNQAPVEIINSPLSEAGVLGFEYGYSLDCPGGLVIWEAQFGDFCNAAQVIVDQFLASAEDKWRRLSGLVLLLPHGFEGMGPEHSSARLERFLALFAQDNIQVASPTTPAQFFHLLRRQVLRTWRKPLVVMTPKSLLRHPQVVSSLTELASGTFQRVLPDALDPHRPVKRVLLCSGKIYYELAARRGELNASEAAILRVEQLAPLPEKQLEIALATYPAGTPVFWVQEEPENMGAWRYLRVKFGETLFGRFAFAVISRPASASPATGSARRHHQEQQQLIERAFAGLEVGVCEETTVGASTGGRMKDEG